jgi:HAE1 family hydrophobic/amphiphilic exporter-1
MIIGGVLTVLIVFAFLNSWRSTVITGLTLPISVIAAFTVMRIFGFTLNVMTLMGLSLAIGMLIDDAIVVRENIVRHLQRGKDHVEASLDGTNEIGLAVMATTFTIVAVFIPVAFMGGMVGKFFYEFGITVAAAVLVSLFVSFTLDPMLSSRWVDPALEQDRHDGVVGRALARFNHWFDRLHGTYERAARLGAAPPRVGARPRGGRLPGELPHPRDPRRRLHAGLQPRRVPDRVQGDARGDPARDRRAREGDGRAAEGPPDVEYTYTTVGASGTTYRPVTEGTTYVKLKSASGKTFSQVLSEARTVIQQVPGLTYGLFEAGPFGQKPIQISVRGASVDELDRISRDLMQAMAKIPGIADVETSLEKSKPELQVRVDRARASDLGVPAGVIGSTLGAAVAGQVATVIEDAEGDSHDVRVRLKGDQRRFGSDLLELTVPTDKDDANGDKLLVALREMARAESGSGPSTIRRKDLVREVRVSANPDGRSLGEISADIEKAAARIQMPPGYDLLMGGDAEELKDMFDNMLQALFLAVVFIYLILASQFGSFTQPLAIMLSLPLSLFGVAVALLLTHDTLNIMSMIGLIMLMGLVTKNAILLVDFTNQARREGMSRNEALIKAGSTRLRPIVMTTLAMIFGMLPLAVRDRRRRRDAGAHGPRGHRRAHHLHPADARGRARRVHVPRRDGTGLRLAAGAVPAATARGGAPACAHGCAPAGGGLAARRPPLTAGSAPSPCRT